MARDAEKYPLTRILDVAGNPAGFEDIRRLLIDDDPAIRYWATIHLHSRAVPQKNTALTPLLLDSSIPVRIEAATILARGDNATEAIRTLAECLESERVEDVLHAARALQTLGKRSDPAKEAVRKLFSKSQELLDARNSHPCWLFVLFSTDALLWELEPDSPRERIRF